MDEPSVDDLVEQFTGVRPRASLVGEDDVAAMVEKSAPRRDGRRPAVAADDIRDDVDDVDDVDDAASSSAVVLSDDEVEQLSPARGDSYSGPADSVSVGGMTDEYRKAAERGARAIAEERRINPNAGTWRR